MSSKLLMNNIVGGDNMQIQKGTVTATLQNENIRVRGLTFVPDIVIVRIISDVSTSTHSLVWVYTPYFNIGIRTDSEGISHGISTTGKYTDNGYTTSNDYNSFGLIDGGFTFTSVNNTYGVIQPNDQFEWTAIKYL